MVGSAMEYMNTMLPIRILAILVISLVPLPVTSIFGLIRPSATSTRNGVWDYKNFIPWDDYFHNPSQLRNHPSLYRPWPLSPYVNGSTVSVPAAKDSPDFRLPEGLYLPQVQRYQESGRYYRLQPLHLYVWSKWRPKEGSSMFNCYCVTVYKRTIPLAMGAVLTYRHVLTSALATDLIVTKYQHKPTLENILGAWYNTDLVWPRYTNSVYYMTPARIQYHPKWNPPENTNRSHPLPCVFDLALWTSTKKFYFDAANWFFGEYLGYGNYGYLTAICQRWSNYYGGNWAPVYSSEKFFVIGCQMIMDLNRTPYPWFKYAMRFQSSGIMKSCPKNDWDWFFCHNCMGPQMKFGVEPGAALHFSPYDGWRYQGLAGLNSFSMKLRSKNFVNYFTILDRHPVLEFLYDAVKARTRHAYLDRRFRQTRDRQIFLSETGQFVSQANTAPTEWYNEWDAPAGYNKSFKTYYDPIWWK